MATVATGGWLLPCAAQSATHRGQTDKRGEQTARLVTEGVAALERHDMATARSLFQQALKSNPQDVTAHTYLGVLADGAGELKQAEHHFSTAAAIAPTSPAARNNYGAILLKLGRPKHAASQFEASLRLNTNQPNALVNLAQIRFASGTPGDLRAARELFERAHSLAPDAEIARAMIVIALRLAERETAARYFREYSQRLASASRTVSLPAERAELGSALLEGGLPTEAVTELKSVVDLEPSNTEAILRLAKAYLALNDMPSAGRTLEAAVARGHHAAPIYALLASVYEKSGHLENAIPAWRLAIQHDPQSEMYRFSYGMLLTNTLAPDAAVIRLKEALEMFPRSARLWLAMGIAHFKAGRNDEAAKALTRALELDPKLAPAYAYLGMMYVDGGQYDEALKSYSQALAINAQLGVVDYLIADALLRQPAPDTVRPEAHLRRALKLEPSFAPAHLALGKLYFRQHRLVEAASALQRVTQLDPHLAEAYFQLSRVYGRLKRPSEAQAALATFKQLRERQKEQEQNNRKEIVQRLTNVLF